MSTEKSIQQLHDEIVANYKDQIDMLRSINESNDRIIKLYERQQEFSDKYIAALKEQVFELQQQVIRLL